MLNNHGWGMREMIIYTCILLFFLLIAAYFVNALYNSLDADLKKSKEKTYDNSPTIVEREPEKVIDYSIYSNYEKQMDVAAKNYVINNYEALETNIATVDLQELVDADYIEQLYDQISSEKCIGYSNVWDNELGEYEVDSYIRCSNYVTEGY